MERNDIVDTLRRNQFYYPTSRINSFGMPQMGFEMTSFNLIAADEIERLRSVVEAWLKYSQRAEREIERLRAERDEVRKSYCSLMEAYRGGDGRVTANKLGWGYLFEEDGK